MSIVVIKFGGAAIGNEEAFAGPENMPKLARMVKLEQEKGNDVVVVVSAMSGVTRKLKAMCETLVPSMIAASQDVVLTSGEQIATGLMSGLLNSIGVKAETFLAWQLPIVTDSVFGGATIKEIGTERIFDRIKKGIVPVIAGYQGITEYKHLSTLGFDGSDTTAVAVAGAIKAEKCVFLKDVRAVYSANPRRVAKACRINDISFEEMRIFAELGSRILHPNSVKLAKNYGVQLQLKPSFDDSDQGSFVNGVASGRDIFGLTYYQHTLNNITISLVGSKIKPDYAKKMIKALNEEKIFAEEKNLCDGYMNASVEIGWIEQLDRALSKLHTLFDLDDKNPSSLPAFVGEGKQVYDPAVKK